MSITWEDEDVTGEVIEDTLVQIEPSSLTNGQLDASIPNEIQVDGDPSGLSPEQINQMFMEQAQINQDSMRQVPPQQGELTGGEVLFEPAPAPQETLTTGGETQGAQIPGGEEGVFATLAPSSYAVKQENIDATLDSLGNEFSQNRERISMLATFEDGKEESKALQKKNRQILSAMTKESNKPLFAAFEDVFSSFTRGLAGLKNVAMGEGSEGFVKALQDPQAGIFKESREDALKFWSDKAKAEDNVDLKQFYTTMGTLSSIGYGLAEDPTTYLGPGIGAGGLAKGISGKMKPAGVPRKALISPEGVPLSPAQALGKESSFPELYFQMNPLTAKRPAELKIRQEKILKGKASKVSEKLNGKMADEIDPSKRGGVIEELAETAERITKERFAEGEAKIKQAVGRSPANYKEINMLDPVKPGLVDKNLRPITNVVRKVIKTDATQRIDNMLKGIGYEVPDKFKNIKVEFKSLGELSGTKKIGPDGIKKALEFRNNIIEAKTVSELMNVKQTISSELFKVEQKGLFQKGGRDLGFLKGINESLNKAIEESIKTIAPGQLGENLADVFKGMNKMYGDNIDALKFQTKKLSIGRQDFDPANVLAKIRRIGSKNLNKMKEQAANKPEIKALYKELQKGAYEDLLYRSLDKTYTINPTKFVNSWQSLDKTMRKSLFPQSLIGEVDKLVDTFKRVTSGDLAKFNPSGTARANLVARLMDNPKTIFTSVLSWPAAHLYYKTGDLPHQSIWNLIKASGGGVYMTTKKLNNLRRAESLGNVIRAEYRTGKEE